MKKTNRKKLGNKGFSLVELIVVIAIMAILVGVLAPSLLKNIEKSREAKDMTALDTIYSAIQTAYASDKAALAAPTGAWTELTNTNLASTTNAFYVEVSDNIGSDSLPTFASKVGKTANAEVYFMITAEGKVSVKIADTAAAAAVNSNYSTFIIE